MKIFTKLPQWKKVKKSTWYKDLLLSFIGTTLSIILTFGTAHVLDEKQKVADGRQTALMIIHDMENSEEQLHQMVDAEDEQYKAAQHVLNNLSRIDEIAFDTLVLVADYITDDGGIQYSYDDSSERIFLSSPDVWKNINSTPFIDAVQTYFNHRRESYELFKHLFYFRKPINQQDLLQNKLQKSSYMGDLAQYIRDYIQTEEVRFYIGSSATRKMLLNQAAESFMESISECKFMMDISDEELKQYVSLVERTGKRVREKQLVGEWKLSSSLNIDTHYTYYKDHTFQSRFTQSLTNVLYTGELLIHFSASGTWELKGDSLTEHVLTAIAYEMDTSRLSYMEENAAAFEQLLNEWKTILDERFAAAHENETETKTYLASIDKSGNKIELRRKTINERGAEEVQLLYLER